MKKQKNQDKRVPELDDDDKAHISGIFFEETVPKLIKWHARIGVINCDFAGEKYSHWSIHFRSKGRGFEIVEFEYDEEASAIDLDL